MQELCQVCVISLNELYESIVNLNTASFREHQEKSKHETNIG
jgi:hypothetical protein